MPLKHTGTVPDANKLLLMVRPEHMRLMGSEHSDSEGRCYSWCQSTSGVLDRVFSSIDARIDKQLQAVEEVFNTEIKKLGLGA